VLLTLGEAIDPALNQRVHGLAAQLQSAALPGVQEIVPAYCTLLIHYDPAQTDYDRVQRLVNEALAHETTQTAPTSRRIEIPVVYDGPDLPFTADYHRLSVADVIALHTAAEYRVYMMGFTPGFAYLGEVDARIATPRLETPRVRVPAGSVGIAGRQTGIYPIDSPGGWRILGHTSLKLFDLQRDAPFLLAPGDRVRFVRVDGETT
jgi:KipI family sensor histidine kinase inhibitor